MVETDDAEGEERREEEWVALGKIVMPGITTIEYREGLCDIEVQEAEGWKGPLLIVEAVDDGRASNDESSERAVSLVC